MTSLHIIDNTQKLEDFVRQAIRSVSYEDSTAPIFLLFENARFLNTYKVLVPGKAEYGDKNLVAYIAERFQREKPDLIWNLQFNRCTFDALVADAGNSKINTVCFSGCNIQKISSAPNFCKHIAVCNNSKIQNFNLDHQNSSKHVEVNIQIEFIDSTFENISMIKCHFKKAVNFENCIFGNAADKTPPLRLMDCKFNDAVNFSDCVFLNAPLFFKSEFSSSFDFRHCTFKDFRSNYAENAYSHLKHIMISLNSDYNMIEFNAHELSARHNVRLKGGLEKIYSSIYRATNDFGRNFKRPLISLVLFVIAFSEFYIILGGFYCTSAEFQLKWAQALCSYERFPSVTSIYMAAKYALGPFGLFFNTDNIQPNNFSVKALSFAHLLLSSYIWFMIVMQVRVRFKLS
ncbi:MAG: pentapeptide repeat-containing protein [Alphaproteobacteria bacterium]|nr:pentapeptide repeat-containing protein [Alphaproteobacteria bacterium]